MNYEEMSDFEINAAVTSVVHDCKGWELNWTNSCFFHCGIDGSGYYSQSINDYCNNPSDAWPIIVDNKIGLMHTWHSKGVWSAVAPVSRSDYDYNHDNPLRAAMICFLKMQDTKQ